jgi:hypothetical protein
LEVKRSIAGSNKEIVDIASRLQRSRKPRKTVWMGLDRSFFS